MYKRQDHFNAHLGVVAQLLQIFRADLRRQGVAGAVGGINGLGEAFGHACHALCLEGSRAGCAVFAVRFKAGADPIGKPVISAGVSQQIKRHHFPDIVIGHHTGALQGIRRIVPLAGRAAQVFERSGKLQHRVPRLLQVVFPADNSCGDRKPQFLIFHPDIIPKLPGFMLVARQHRQIHRIQHIGDGGLCVICQPHFGVLLHLIGIREGGAVQGGDAHLVCVGEILHIGFSAVDVGKGHPFRAYSVEPCHKLPGIHHTLDGFHVLLVGKKSAAVLAVDRQQMHQPVRAVKDQVAAVKVCCISEDGQGILFRTGPGALCPYRHRTDAPLSAL